MNLEIVGKLENLAPRERIYSVRFMQDKAFVVTFKKVAPLFVLDLEDPAEPRVLGKLKVPGFSTYLHPLGEGYLIGLGRETVEAEEGDFAWFQRLKLSLFDVRDYSNPRELDKVIIGDRGTESEALHDHKAFLLDEERGILVIPVLLAVIQPSQRLVEPNIFGEYVFQGAYVFKISPETGIELLRRITHMPDNRDFMRSVYYFSSEYTIRKALYIDDILYTISSKKIMIHDIETLEIGEVELAVQ